MSQVLILTIVFVIGAVIGLHYLIEYRWFGTFLYVLGAVIWVNLTYIWWATKIVGKYFGK